MVFAINPRLYVITKISLVLFAGGLFARELLGWNFYASVPTPAPVPAPALCLITDSKGTRRARQKEWSKERRLLCE